MAFRQGDGGVLLRIEPAQQGPIGVRGMAGSGWRRSGNGRKGGNRGAVQRIQRMHGRDCKNPLCAPGPGGQCPCALRATGATIAVGWWLLLAWKAGPSARWFFLVWAHLRRTLCSGRAGVRTLMGRRPWAYMGRWPWAYMRRGPWAHVRMRRWPWAHILPAPRAPVVAPGAPHPLAALPGVVRPGHARSAFGAWRWWVAVLVVDHGFVAVVAAMAVLAFGRCHYTTGQQHARCQHSAPAHR